MVQIAQDGHCCDGRLKEYHIWSINQHHYQLRE